LKISTLAELKVLSKGSQFRSARCSLAMDCTPGLTRAVPNASHSHNHARGKRRFLRQAFLSSTMEIEPTNFRLWPCVQRDRMVRVDSNPADDDEQKLCAPQPLRPPAVSSRSCATQFATRARRGRGWSEPRPLCQRCPLRTALLATCARARASDV
jgi:hypothetical protein